MWELTLNLYAKRRLRIVIMYSRNNNPAIIVCKNLHKIKASGRDAFSIGREMCLIRFDAEFGAGAILK